MNDVLHPVPVIIESHFQPKTVVGPSYAYNGDFDTRKKEVSVQSRKAPTGSDK